MPDVETGGGRQHVRLQLASGARCRAALDHVGGRRVTVVCDFGRDPGRVAAYAVRESSSDRHLLGFPLVAPGGELRTLLTLPTGRGVRVVLTARAVRGIGRLGTSPIAVRSEALSIG